MSILDRLTGAVPPFVAQDPVMAEAYQAVAAELELVLGVAAETPEQAWPQLTSWAIDRLEEIYDVPRAPDTGLEQRRSVLLAKMRAAPVSTLARIINVATSYGGQGIELTEHPVDQAIHISILDELGHPAYLEAMKASLRSAVPAHLAITFALRWLLWQEILARGDTWVQIRTSGVSWANLKEHGEV